MGYGESPDLRERESQLQSYSRELCSGSVPQGLKFGWVWELRVLGCAMNQPIRDYKCKGKEYEHRDL